MCWGICRFFKNKYRGIKSLSQHFEKEIYQYVHIAWLLLTGKPMCGSPFLILSIAKYLRPPILKNICKRLLLKICSWNWETLKFIHKSFNLTSGFFSISIRNKFNNGISWLVSHEVFIHIQYFSKKKKTKLQEKNISCERALNFDQWKNIFRKL